MGSLRAYAHIRGRLERELEKLIEDEWEELSKYTIESAYEGRYYPLDEQKLRELLAVLLVVSYFYGLVDSMDIRELLKISFPYPENELEKVAKEFLLKNKRLLTSMAGRRNVKEVAEWLVKHAHTGPLANIFARYSDELLKEEINQFRKKLIRVLQKATELGLKGEEEFLYLNQELKRFGKTKLMVIGRTEITRAYNVGLLKASFLNPTLTGYRFQAVLDNRTSLMCRERHGMFIPKDNIALLAANTPPLHPNCRSRLVPVYGPPPMNARLIYEATTPPIKRDVDIEFVTQALGSW